MLDGWQKFTPNTPWQDGVAYGTWYNQFSGYGVIETKPAASGAVLSLYPEILNSTDPNQGHAALVTSTASFGNMDATVVETTVSQLRVSKANPWEVAWVLWHYTDNTHFYSITLQPNGWELGKEDPAYPGANRFLVTGSKPVFPVGVPYTVRVVQVQAKMAVYVNGVLLTTFTDQTTPYLSGSYALYTEEASATFGNVMMTKATSV